MHALCWFPPSPSYQRPGCCSTFTCHIYAIKSRWCETINPLIPMLMISWHWLKFAGNSRCLRQQVSFFECSVISDLLISLAKCCFRVNPVQIYTGNLLSSFWNEVINSHISLSAVLNMASVLELLLLAGVCGWSRLYFAVGIGGG